MTYNPKNANPFESVNTYKEWSGNNLILTDAAMRSKAGVSALDADVSEIFNKGAPAVQAAGAAYGAPFHLMNYGAPNAQAYTQTGGMQMASHYFNNDRRW
jgi:hypothetical protein